MLRTFPQRERVRHGLVDHLTSVAKIAGEFCRSFDSHDAGYYAGLWHDIGKFNPEFQRYLAGDHPGWLDHKGAGTKLALKHIEPLALLVQGHHGGLKAMKDCQGCINEKDSNTATDQAIEYARQAVPELEPKARITPPLWTRNDRHRAELFKRAFRVHA